MKKLAVFLLLATPAFGTTYLVTVAGLGGEPDYEQRFQLLANDTDKLLKAGGGTDRVVETFKGPDATRTKVTAALNQIASQAKAQDVFVLMMIGHGTFDGAEYKFNLPGPDISGTELAGILNRIPASRQLVVDMTSSSGGVTQELKKDGRTVITATKNGMEKNATVFARFWVEALRDPAADTDKNETVSALEAFHYAQTKTEAFFKDQKRLATEHAQLEDQNRAATFTLIRYGSAAAEGNNPAKRDLVAKKEEIENKIDALKFEKDLMNPEDYRKQIGALLLELAKTQELIDK
ncbi:MAG: hypothetical protein KGN84_15555 [Acidobacteriota bacterium]|nr:hypothetical protein [Acidobacteriota bacterium]